MKCQIFGEGAKPGHCSWTSQWSPPEDPPADEAEREAIERRCTIQSIVEECERRIRAGSGTDEYVRDMARSQARLWKWASAKSCPAADWFAGRCLQLGLSGEPDESAAVLSFRYAAERGLRIAQYDLAQCYHAGRGVAQSDEEALKWYARLDTQDCPHARFRIGMLLCSNPAAPEGAAEGLKRIREAADGGHVEAAFELGCLYLNDPALVPQGREYLKRAAKGGSKLAVYRLAESYRSEYEKLTAAVGTGGDEEERARQREGAKKNWLAYLRKAADLRVPEAQFILARHDLSEGTDPQKVKAAIRILEGLADSDHPEVALLLADCLWEGRPGVPKRPQEAAKYYRMASEAGVPGALVRLGECYEHGIGLPPDREQAKRCYQQAAEAGSSEGQNRLGLYYECEMRRAREAQHDMALAKMIQWKRLPGNRAKLAYEDRLKSARYSVDVAAFGRMAAECYAAASAKLPEAKVNLARCYEEGIGAVKQDPREAFRQYCEAASRGCPQAILNVGRCHERGIGTPKSSEDARKCYEEAEKMGCHDALLVLGEYFESSRDATRACEYFYRAAATGSPKALAHVGYHEASQCLNMREGTAKKAGLAEAARKLKEAASSGDAFAEYTLSWYYLSVSRKTTDIRHGYDCLVHSAGRGYCRAQLDLARRYSDPRDRGGQDLDTARFWFTVAAESGDAEAQYELGCRLDDGVFEGGKHPYAARYWLTRAAMADHAEAQYRLGCGLADGVFEDGKNLDAARYWLDRASNNGHKGAAQKLKKGLS